MVSRLGAVMSSVDEEIIILDDNYNIIKFSEDISKFLYQSDLHRKNISDLKIGEFLFRYMEDHHKTGRQHELSNISIKNKSQKLIVNDRHKGNYYNISKREYEEGTILIFKTIVAKNLKKKYINILSKDSDIVAELISVDNAKVLYDSRSGDISNDEVNLLDNIHSDDIENLKQNINESCNKNKDKHTRVRANLFDRDWVLYDINIRQHKECPYFENVIINGYNINDQYLFEQRRAVINRVLRHDLRNEMNVIRGYAANLKNDSNNNERTIQSAEKIIEKSDRLISLGDEVREIDQEMNRLDRKLRKLNLRVKIQEKIKYIHSNYSDVNFIVRSPDNVYILGNSMIGTAVEQLIENAIVHNDNPNEQIEVYINIETEEEDGKVRLSIIDNGPGIEKSQMSVINTGVETPLDHVNGLGLWMVRWISDIVGGDFHIKDIPEGTCATIEFYDDSHTPEDVKPKNQNTMGVLNKLNRLNDNGSDNISTSTRDE